LDEFLSLPPEAQEQVVTFIAFLKQSYIKSEPVFESRDVDLTSDPFIGMWQDRQDLANSSAWVRNVRENEWSKQCD
jgi:hypothetical protein